LMPPISTKVSTMGANITDSRRIEADTSLSGGAIDAGGTPARANSPAASADSSSDGISAMGQASRE
jgi:hypothetical protein